MRLSRPSGRRLFAALLLAISSFVGSTVISELAAGAIHDRVDEMSKDALPSIEHLTAVRTELFRMQALAEQLVRAPQAERPALRRELQLAQSTVESQFAAYRDLPVSPGEAHPTLQLHDELAAVAANLSELIAPGRNIGADSLVLLDPSIERASSTASALIGVNAGQAEELARRIDRARHRAALAAYALDALSATLALVVSLLAWRTVQYYLATLEAQQKLLGERAQELEAFSGRVAHDITNPLSAVSISLDLLDRGVAPEKVVGRARSSLRRAQSIVDALLAFARAGAHAEPGASCDASQIIAEVVSGSQERAQKAAIELELSVPPGLTAACHAGVLTSIVGNLLGNAIKYLDSNRPERRVRVLAGTFDDRIWCEVEDTGPGIPVQLRRTIFEPYVRGAHHVEPGIGLGLATVKKLCEAHGGTISLRSELGVGSAFRFELPRGQAARIERAERTPAPPLN